MKRKILSKILLILFMLLGFTPITEAASRYWVGGTGNWSQTAHWSTTSGGGSGASVPVAADIAIFDGSSGGGTCTINQTVSVGGILLDTGNTTTVSQGAFNVTVGTQNGVLKAGTFTGSSSSVATTFSGSFTLDGATFNQMSSAVTFGRSAYSDVINFTSGTFTGSSSARSVNFYGTFTLNGATLTQNAAPIYFRYSATNYTTAYFSSGTFTAGSAAITFYPDTIFSGGTFTGGSGNITFATGRTFTLSGASMTAPATPAIMRFYGPATLSAGTFTAGTGSLIFSSTFTLSGATLSASLGAITFSGASTLTSGTLTGSTGNLAFNNTFTLNGATFNQMASAMTIGNYTTTFSSGTFTAGTAALTISGNTTLSGATFTGGSGNITFSRTFALSGASFTASSGTTTFTGAASFSAGTFTGGAGSLLFASTFTLNGANFTATSGTATHRSTFTISSGTFTHNSGTVAFTTNSFGIDPGAGVDFNNVTFNGAGRTYTVPINKTLSVLGTLELTDGRITTSGTGSVDAKGDINVASTADSNTAGTLTLNGTGDQQIACSGSAPGGFLMTRYLKIDKTAGIVNISGNCQLRNVSLLSGTLNLLSGTYTIMYGTTYGIATSAGTSLNFSGSIGDYVILRSSSTTTNWTLSVNASASYSASYVDVARSNASTGKEIVATESIDSLNNINWVFPKRLVFTTSPQSVLPGAISLGIIVQLQSDSKPVNVPSSTQINLTTSSGTGQFSTSSTFATTTTFVTIPMGSSSATFYYRDQTAGTYTITAAEFPSKGWTDATQIISVESKGAWKYRAPITVTSSVGLSDYQVLITLNTQSLISAGKMKSDGSDIRFYDTTDTTSLSYWIEEGTINTTATKIWVKFPLVSIGSNTIYIYYGNLLATAASSITNTFIFGDEFAVSAIDIAKWNTTNASPLIFTISGDELRATSTGTTTTGRLQSRTLFSAPIILEASVRITSLATNGIMTLGTWLSTTDGFGIMAYPGVNPNPTRYYYRNNSAWVGPTNTSNLFTTQHRETITASNVSDGVQINLTNGSLSYTASNTNAISNEPITLGLRYNNGNTNQAYDCRWDWILARQYASSVPAASIGTEQKNITQMDFITTTQTLIQNQVSNLMTIQTQAVDGTPANTISTTTIQLTTSSSSGSFSLDGSMFQSSLSATILSGQNTLSFYYRDSQVGTPTITAFETPSQGWTDATQQVIINPAVNNFLVQASSPQVSGSPFTLTITAIDQDGSISQGYSGTVNITVHYISPATGVGTLAATVESNFINGVATITNQSFSDCGTITVTATKADDPSKTGTSNNIVFVPFDFSVIASGLDKDGVQTVNKPFTLTTTARNAAGQTCPNYKGPANVSINYIEPLISQSGAISPAQLGAGDWQGGIAVISTALYNKWGTVAFIASDNLLTTQKGTSQNIFFLPKDFLVTPSDPPPLRKFYYVDEPFRVSILARDQNNEAVANYQGAVAFAGAGLKLPTDYTFNLEDSGLHTLDDISSSSELEGTTISVNDKTSTDILGKSNPIIVKDASIKAFSNQGPIGNLAITVAVVDSKGDIIQEDNATSFKISLEEIISDDSASSEAMLHPVTVNAGKATVIINDNEAEVVTVSPEAVPALKSISATATFGTVSGSGLGVQIYRELKEKTHEKD